MTWYGLKDAAEQLFPVPKDMMHVHVGLAIFLLCALLLRPHRHGLVLAWLVTFSLEITNETLDARDWIAWTGHVNWPESAKDIVDTLLWPSLLLAATRGIRLPALPRPDAEALRRVEP